MPKDTSGTVPPSKSQRNKAAKLAKLAKKGGAPQHGGKCTRCGQVSSSSTPGETHLGCPEDKALWGFELAYRLRAPFLKKYVGAEGRGIWLSKEDYDKYEIEIDAYLASVRNFSTENMRWENGYGEPINFLTREVLVVSESISVETPIEETVSTDEGTTEETQAA